MPCGKPFDSGRRRWLDGRRWIRRFVVAEESMLPRLRPGDGLIAVDVTRIRRGEIRVFEHPERPGMWLVKRVGDIVGDTFEARSDNDVPGVVDSRRLGLIPIGGSYRVVKRIPARLLG